MCSPRCVCVCVCSLWCRAFRERRSSSSREQRLGTRWRSEGRFRERAQRPRFGRARPPPFAAPLARATARRACLANSGRARAGFGNAGREEGHGRVPTCGYGTRQHTVAFLPVDTGHDSTLPCSYLRIQDMTAHRRVPTYGYGTRQHSRHVARGPDEGCNITLHYITLHYITSSRSR